MPKSEVVKNRPYTARDVKNMAGLTYRQLNDWEERGALPSNEQRGEGWRTFSPSDLFGLMICTELRRHYGIPVEKLKFITDLIEYDGETHLAKAIRLIQQGVSILLITDLEKKFLIECDLELEDLVYWGFLREDGVKPILILRLNAIIEEFLPALGSVTAPKDGPLYRKKAEFDYALRVHTVAELELLEAVRCGNFDNLNVKILNGKIAEMDAEGDIPNETVHNDSGQVRIPAENSFETLTVSRHKGQIVRARRKLPRKFSKKENRPTVFILKSDL